MLGFLLSLLLIGLLAGALARLVVPGRDPMGIGGTILLGVVGSFIGGLLSSLVFAGELTLQPGGIIGSIIGAIIALLIYRRVSAA